MISDYDLLLVPFSVDAKKKAAYVSMSVSAPEKEDLEFVIGILEKIVSGKYSIEKSDDLSVIKKYYVFYPYARIILSIHNKSQSYQKFSEYYYKQVLREVKDKEIDYLDLLKLKYDVQNNLFLISFKEYIYAKIIKDKDKVLNKAVAKGYVWIDKEELPEFIARFIATKVLDGLPVDTADVSKMFAEFAKHLQKYELKKEIRFASKNTTIDYNRFPPCMLKILHDLLNGGKPSHIERYYLATFLFALKMDFEKILEIYSKAADYNEKIARYQLEKIKNYSPPTCNTLKSMGICDAESCGEYNSPIEYYFRQRKKSEIDIKQQ